jgi:hypothetical protein
LPVPKKTLFFLALKGRQHTSPGKSINTNTWNSNRLLKRWNLFCPEDCQMNDDQFNEIIANSIMVTAYQLQTHALDFGVKGTEIGFSGSCFYKIKNSVPNKIKEIIHVLIMFSFFAGIGYGSPKGMGQINLIIRLILNRKHNFIQYSVILENQLNKSQVKKTSTKAF